MRRRASRSKRYLFVCGTQVLLDDAGHCVQRNDVALAGLFHKLGYRGTTTLPLSFGENNACVGYGLANPIKALNTCSNDERSAPCRWLWRRGYRLQGYQHSLAYASERPQGRHVSTAILNRPKSISLNIPMSNAACCLRKSLQRGPLMLCLYGARLVDDMHTAEVKPQRRRPCCSIC